MDPLASISRTVGANSFPAIKSIFAQFSDEELWELAHALAKDERESTYELVQVLAEIDNRGLAIKRSQTSLFTFCVYRLKMSEGAAYRRIRAARALRLHSVIGPLLRDGRLSLESIAVLQPYLRDPDAPELIRKATGLKSREVERLVADRRAEEPRREVIRLQASLKPQLPPPEAEESPPGFDFARSGVPEPAAAASAEPIPGAPTISPIPPTAASASTDGYAVRIAFTAGEAFEKRLRLTQAAMRHKYPKGQLDGIFFDAMDALLRKKTPWAYRKPRAAPRKKAG